MVLSGLRRSLYYRSLRRRYGIPDDDKRPFAIAYAAARTRTDEDLEEDSREASEISEDGHLPPHRGHPNAPMLVRRRRGGGDVDGASCPFHWSRVYSPLPLSLTRA